MLLCYGAETEILESLRFLPSDPLQKSLPISVQGNEVDLFVHYYVENTEVGTSSANDLKQLPKTVLVLPLIHKGRSEGSCSLVDPNCWVGMCQHWQ